jgi:PAS domain S-box-containing protein
VFFVCFVVLLLIFAPFASLRLCVENLFPYDGFPRNDEGTPMSRLAALFLLTFCAVLPWHGLSAQSSDEAVRIGILAKRGDEATLNRWRPTAQYLNQEIPGYRFSIVPLDFEAIGRVVSEGGIEFVLANSAIYVELEAVYGAGRIATLRNRNGVRGYTQFGGVIFTRADRSDINTIADLRGLRFAAVKENSFGGYLMAWREMEDFGVTPARDTVLSFPGTHDAVVHAVLEGRVDAGTVRTDTLERMAAEGRIDLSQVKVLNQQFHEEFGFLRSTRLYPEWPIARLAHTSERLSDAVARALLRMPADSAAAIAGQVDGWTVPRNYQPVHELMRELRVGPYAQLGRITLTDLLRNYWHWLLLTLLALLVLSATTAYVSRLNSRLRRAEGELIGARDQLAEKVRERTAELEESHRRLERISRDWNDAFDAISDPIFIHDTQMRLVQANPAYCERAGEPLEAMLGRPYYHFFPRLDGPLPACEAFPEHLHPEGNELELPDGEIFVSRSFAITRADKSIRHAIHILEDVTAVRRAEARRRILSRAVEQAGEGVLILDRERQVLYCNPGLRQLLGRDEHDLLCRPAGTDPLQLVRAPFAAQLERLFEEAGRSGNASGEMELAALDGRARPAFVTVGAIHGEDGTNDGYVLTLLDLSRIKQAEAALTYRIGFESVIAGIASALINVEEGGLDEEINGALKRLGEFAGTDRAYLFDYDAAADTIANTHQWSAPGERSAIGRLQRLPFKELPWLGAQLRAGTVVAVPDVDELPEAAAAERAEFRREAIRSLLTVPLSYGGAFAGFVGFDNIRQQRHWAEEDVQLLRTAGEIIINSLGRVRAMLRLRHSEASLAAAQHIAHLGNWDWNIVTGELAWSDEIYRIFGLAPQQFGATYDAFLQTVHPDDREAVIGAVNRAVADEQDYAIDHRIVRPDGSERIVHEIGEVRFSETGEALRMIGTVQDVTELRQSQREMQRLNRALRTLSLCNTTLVHAEREQGLMDAICRILIENGGYRFAWVGYAERDARRTIRPVAHAGYEHGFLDILDLTWSDSESGQSPAGSAVRTADYFIARDIAHSAESFGPWREAALARGYVSVIALPLISEGEVLGVLTIDAEEADAFDHAEVMLLVEMAGDLAFGIRTLRNRRERERAEAALRQTETRYEELYEGAPNGYLSVSAADGRLLQFNQAICDILGYARSELEGKRVFDLYADTEEGVTKAKRLFAGLQSGEGVRDVELQMRHRDGHPVWISVSVDPVLDAAGQVVESRSMVIDISARKRAEVEHLRFAEQLQHSLLQTIRVIALTIEKRDPYTAGHQERVAELAVQIATQLGLSEQRLEGVRLGAMIHDIGKISVPAEILTRPGKLEPELFEIIKAHPMNGYEIISGIDFPWPLAEMVVQHHERLDGSGYPKGLKGDEVLLESRILAVADVVEAMASHRPYRAAIGTELALEEIRRGRGTLYDPQVVDACLALFREKGSPWARDTR